MEMQKHQTSPSVISNNEIAEEEHSITIHSNANSVSNRLKRYGPVVLTSENPIIPEDVIHRTPSLIDGLDSIIENDLRITGCRLIQISGVLLRLPQVAMATGQILFQRFFYSKSLVRIPMEITAMACVVLASKVEEAPRRIRDVINVFHNIKQIRLGQPSTPLMLDENYVYLKNQVIKGERRLLKELGFCVHVKHPHKFIVAVAQILKNESNTDLIQTAWSYMNDSLQTNVFVRFPPETIACACIHLSSRVLRVPLPADPMWFEIFNVDIATINSVCHQILMLYAKKTLPQEHLESQVEQAKLKLDIAKHKSKQQSLEVLQSQNSPKVESHVQSTKNEHFLHERSPSSSPGFKLEKSPPKHKRPCSNSDNRVYRNGNLKEEYPTHKERKSTIKNEDEQIKREHRNHVRTHRSPIRSYVTYNKDDHDSHKRYQSRSRSPSPYGAPRHKSSYHTDRSESGYRSSYEQQRSRVSNHRHYDEMSPISHYSRYNSKSHRKSNRHDY